MQVTNGTVTHAYVYDPDGRMLGEYGTSAADPIVETIWLSPSVASGSAPFGGSDGVGGYAPLAIAGGIGGTATLYWVHGNQLGVPTVITNTTGAVATPTGYTAVGFPGQTRTLADLYYNRYRDYDTTTGRYIQADPIGLEGGENPYVYAGANPLRFTDPWGLAPGDKWYGFNNREFQRWFHKCWKQPGNPDADKKEIAEAYKEWLDRGSPTGGRCDNSGRGGVSGIVKDCPQEQPQKTNRNARIGIGGVILIGGGVVCAFLEPCGAAVTVILTLGGSAVVATAN